MTSAFENVQFTRGKLLAGELYRPFYHFTPPAFWMNDPNGLVYFEHEYHLFYQHYPHENQWGAMHWGHAVSRDLVDWEHLPIALYPDEAGMIFSGSAVVDRHGSAGFGGNSLVAIFTCHNQFQESQHLAYSTDRGRTWIKYAGNPVLRAPGGVKDFRDPKVFWHGGQWVMVLAAGERILFFNAPDLIHWTETGSFNGGFCGAEGVFETPDLFELPIQNEAQTRWVLSVGVMRGAPAGGSGMKYFIGSFDGKCFMAEMPESSGLWLDHGTDFYAAHSWNEAPAGRRLMIGWLNNWRYAAKTPTAGWRGSLSLIRALSLRRTPKGVRLFQHAIPELQALRAGHWHWENCMIPEGVNLLAGIGGRCLEISLKVQLESALNGFGLHVFAGRDERVTIRYAGGRISLDRSQAGLTDFEEHFAQTMSAECLLGDDQTIQLQIWLDRSTIEVFANQGETVLTACAFTSKPFEGLELFTEASNNKIHTLDIHPLNPARYYNHE